ncbi:hypothetical protein ACFOU2_01360 [Bacillus songklensis]|uniref:Uncharacterized protein n=1 Tax=Bacillus songklensis TaxID=1069116 RepID=A0ABV8AZ74_9BACI
MQGSILRGDVDASTHQFTITEVKHVPTQSSLSLEKANSLYRRIEQQDMHEGMMITVNDGWPIFLTSSEVQLLKQDLQSILQQL